MLQWIANKNNTNSQYFIKQCVSKHFSMLPAFGWREIAFRVTCLPIKRRDLFVLTSTWSDGTSGIPSIISDLSALTNIGHHRVITTNKLDNGTLTRTIQSCRLVNKLSNRCVKDCSGVQKDHEVHVLQGGLFFWHYLVKLFAEIFYLHGYVLFHVDYSRDSKRSIPVFNNVRTWRID